MTPEEEWLQRRERALAAWRAGMEAMQPALERATVEMRRFLNAWERGMIRAEAIHRRPSRTGHRHRGTRAWHRRYFHR